LAFQLSVIVPTRDRPAPLRRTLTGLANQDLEPSGYEIIVVDDGSEPPVTVAELCDSPALRVVRLEHGERSAARNAGAAHATGRTLVFIDDDILLEKGALAAHLAAHREWPGALVVGSVRLPEALTQTPFGAFRQRLELEGLPQRRGPVAQPNLCTAQNMSISKDQFLKLGGFDRFIVSAEDQDLALRHSAAGGTIVFLPEAVAVHNDSNWDLRS
jgi:glycosyltransferase involved in cell wall biosynthesis